MKKQWRSKFTGLCVPRARDLGRGVRGRVWGQEAVRKELELHLRSPEQVTRVESLSPELREQLQSLLLQRPQHLIQSTDTRPCWSESPLPELKTKIPRVGGSQISPAPSWTRSGLASAQTSTQDSWARGSGGNDEGRRMERLES